MSANFEQIARNAGFIRAADGSIIPADPDAAGFWEDWQSCCEANGLVEVVMGTPRFADVEDRTGH